MVGVQFQGCGHHLYLFKGTPMPDPTAEAAFSSLVSCRYILIVISECFGKILEGPSFYFYFTNNFAIRLAEILHHSGNFA